MLEVFTVVTRESAELALIVYCVIGALKAVGDTQGARAVILSALVGCAAGTIALLGLGAAGLPHWVLPALTIGLALAIIGLTCGELASLPRLRRAIEHRLGDAEGGRARAVAVGLGLLAGAREALEATAHVLTRASSLASEDLALAVVAALLTTALLCRAWPHLREHLGTHVLFRMSALWLALIAVDMLVGALVRVVDALGASGVASAGLGGDATPAPHWETPLRLTLMVLVGLLSLRRWWREAR